jgi:hypothetical protein
MKPVDAGDIQDQEAQTPEIVRFLRASIMPGSPQAEEVARFLERQLDLENAILEAVANKLPGGLILIVLKEVEDEAYRRGISVCMTEPDPDAQIRTYVRKWFAAKGVNFDYKEES